MKFRKKPVVIDAFQLPTKNHEVKAFNDWCDLMRFHGWIPNGVGSIKIPTLEGMMTAQEGDWIIRGVKGEFYPCKPDIFDATYDSVQE